MNALIGDPYSLVTPSFIKALEHEPFEYFSGRSRTYHTLALAFLRQYAALIMWYVHRLVLGKTRRGGIKIQIVHTGINLKIGWFDWTVNGRQIKITRGEFASLLGDMYALLDATKCMIACILPGPIAEEITREVYMGDRVDEIAAAI